MRSRMKHDEHRACDVIFYLEQWLALLIGIACIAVFLWAALEGHKSFSWPHFSEFGRNALVAIGWSLTMAVGFFGVLLMKFAFYKRSAPQAPNESAIGKVPAQHGASTKDSYRLKSAAANKARG